MSPNELTSGGSASAPMVYKSNPQQTSDASNPANMPKPATPTAPAGSNASSFLMANPSFLGFLQSYGSSGIPGLSGIGPI